MLLVRLVVCILLVSLVTPVRAAAQERAEMRPGPMGEPRSRQASGTAWLPDASPMYALHRPAGGWDLMLHGVVYVHWLVDGGDRGRDQLGATSWLMGMGRRPVGGGELTLKAMLSADPLTVGACGYPDLLATGEFCDGEPLHDRQHPHDVFMELAGVYERALTRGVGLQLYGGLVGEPALGPVAFPHRPSSSPNPIAPIGHHWLDSTHIAFGVATAGVYGRRWKAEASLFNGREPDTERGDLDLDALDSFAGRLWLLPSDRWAFQLSAGRLTEAEVHEVGGAPIDLTRMTASVTYHRPLAGGISASTIAWGRNREQGRATHAFLAETNLSLGDRTVLYGRIEVVEKSGEDLVLAEDLHEGSHTVGKLGLGVVRQLEPRGGLVPGVGVGLTVSRVPPELVDVYGGRTLPGGQLFLRLGPSGADDPEHAH